MNKIEIKKRMKRIVFLIFFLILISFAWWGPYQEHIRIKKSLKKSFSFSKIVV